MLLFAATLAVGCGKSASDKEDAADDVDKSAFSESRVTKLADKYAEGKFTEKDYAEAIDIYEAYSEALLDKAESLVKSVKSAEEFERKFGRYQNKYAYINELNPIIFADEYQMGSGNYQRLQKLQAQFQEKADKIMSRLEGMSSQRAEYGCESDSVAVETVEVAAEENYYSVPDSAI